MEQSFTKTIQGHQLEFNRQMCQSRYNVLLKNSEAKGVLSLQKDDKGIWNANEKDYLPGWFSEITTHVHLAIEENETKDKVVPVFNQFGYLF